MLASDMHLRVKGALRTFSANSTVIDCKCFAYTCGGMAHM